MKQLEKPWFQYKWYNVTIDWNTDGARRLDIDTWISENTEHSRYTACMDDSPTGMSFVYSFLEPEEAIAFRLKFCGVTA